MKEGLENIIAYENKNWSKIFQDELNKEEKGTNKKFSCFWWEDYYKKITGYINNFLSENKMETVLEAGSGSGKATILLNEGFKKFLLDISPIALKYAKYTARKFQTNNLSYIQGDIFSMPFLDNSFDFVWNIGVIEHYSLEDMELILKEMIRVVASDGAVAVGVPNFYSGPILKAWLMKAKFLKLVQGYRLGTENFYKRSVIEKLLYKVCKEKGREISYIKTVYFGNPLPIETPEFIVRFWGSAIEYIFQRNKFLMLLICKFG